MSLKANAFTSTGLSSVSAFQISSAIRLVFPAVQSPTARKVVRAFRAEDFDALPYDFYAATVIEIPGAASCFSETRSEVT
jgi:hypothetical protein